ncbi:MAG: RpiR family carbohydrate utilization transcriptional regulator [Cellvibrionaceae bacterium]|jgi:RpiR family carbohydrate utilization transcriptional regulator
MQVTQSILQKKSTLRKSELKVADFVLEHLTDVIRLRITDLAAQAKVSEPTVIRFCRAIGCNGFQDFKITLAQELAASPSFGQITVGETDSTADYCFKVFDSTADTILQVRDQLNINVITQAVNALSIAKRVEFFGFGASGAVAADAQHKFFRLQLATAAHSDHHIQSMSAASMQEGDVVVAISQSGRTSALLHSLSLVKEAGGTVIAIGPSLSPLSAMADIAIEINVEEDTEIYTPLSSRIVHLVVIDVLAIGVAQRRGPELNEHLLKLKRGLKKLRV